MKRAWWLGLVLMGCVGQRPPVAPGAEVLHYPIDDYRLPNGLRVVLEEAPNFGRAGAVLLVGAGSADEKPDQAGLAHLVEHLAFEAKHEGTGTRREEWQGLGAAAFNGMTSWDSTTYFAFVPQPNLGALLTSLAKLVRSPLADADETVLSHERQIVTNELRLRDENGAPGQAFGWLASSLFPAGHAYAHSVSGTLESLSRLRLDDARAFAAAHYRPESSTLVVTAALRAPTLRAMVAEAFGSLPSAKRPASPSMGSASPQRGPGLGQIPAHTAPVAAPELWIGWTIPGAAGPESDIPELLAEMVGGTFWSNVYDRDRDISRVDAGVRWGTQASVFLLRVMLKEAKNPGSSARSVVREMLHGFSNRTHTFDAFDVYKRFEATERTYSEEPAVERALHMAWSTYVHDDPVFIRGRGTRMVALTAARVADFYRQYLDPDLAHAIVIRPATGGGAVPPEGRRSGAGDRRSVPPPDPRITQSWLMPLGVARARQTRLDSGLEVIVLPEPGSPFHSVLLGFHTGDPGDGTGGVVPAATWAMQTWGPHPALRGVFYRSEFHRDSLRFVLRSTGSAVGLSLELLRRAVDNYQVNWPPPQFTSQLKLFQQADQSPPGALHRALTRALYGSHPYGKQPTPAEVRQVTPNQVYQWMSNVVRGNNGVLIIVGDVDEDQAVAAATREFGGFHRTPQPLPPVSAPPPLERAQADGADRVIIRHQPGSTQAYVTFSCVLPPATPESLMAQRLFKAMLERRFFAELREKQASSYVVDAGLEVLRGGSARVELFADVDYADLGAALGKLRRYVEEPAERALEDSLLASARAEIASQFNLSHSTTLAVAETLFGYWNRGWPIAAVDRHLNRLFTTGLEQVRLISDQCRNNSVLAVRGDETSIRAAWQAAIAKQASPAGGAAPERTP